MGGGPIDSFRTSHPLRSANKRDQPSLAQPTGKHAPSPRQAKPSDRRRAKRQLAGFGAGELLAALGVGGATAALEQLAHSRWVDGVRLANVGGLLADQERPTG